ncbi:MAG: hypothetical protein KDB57_09450 [Solirubrobacterales bacterium]|nr:hypothetical protein [Solirubrobacterales bacterium]
MNSLEARLRDWLDRVSRLNPPSWTIGILIALLGWKVGFAVPSSGLDASWWSGLYMGADTGLHYGTEIVFTYGPLGVLRLPWLFYDGWLSFLPYAYGSLLFVGFCTVLVATLRRRVGLVAAALIALLVVVQLGWIETSVALAVITAYLMIDRRPSERGMFLLAAAAGIFAGPELLVKLSSGPVIALVLLLGLIGARAGARVLGTYLATLFFSTLGLWLISGQAISNLPDFLSNSIQIVSGYQEAMSLYGESGWYAPIIVVSALVAFGWSAWGRYPDQRSRWAAGLIAALVLFAFYKQAVVRIDRAHIATYFALAALLWLSIPPRRGLVPVSLAGLAVLAALGMYSSGSTPSPGLNVIDNLKHFGDETRTAVSTARQKELIASYRASIQQGYGLSEELQEQLRGRSVSITPWETTIAWAFDMDWSPAPVFQNYSAYTSSLDQLNAERVESDSGPERVLRHIGPDLTSPGVGIDGRLHAWDPPAQAVATLCHFRPTGEAGVWQVLARIPDRCGLQRPAGEVKASFDESVVVPRPGPREVILVRIDGTEPSGLEKIESFFYRPPERRATLDSGTYRLVPATAGDGLMLRSGRAVKEGGGWFSQIPQSSTIAVTGGSGNLTYSFSRMRVNGSRPQR